MRSNYDSYAYNDNHNYYYSLKFNILLYFPLEWHSHIHMSELHMHVYYTQCHKNQFIRRYKFERLTISDSIHFMSYKLEWLTACVLVTLWECYYYLQMKN